MYVAHSQLARRGGSAPVIYCEEGERPGERGPRGERAHSTTDRKTHVKGTLNEGTAVVSLVFIASAADVFGPPTSFMNLTRTFLRTSFSNLPFLV